MLKTKINEMLELLNKDFKGKFGNNKLTDGNYQKELDGNFEIKDTISKIKNFLIGLTARC